MKASSAGLASQTMEGERKSINPELWLACAGPRVSLPSVGTLVVYFPQGHSEQVAVSTQKDVDGHIPNYPNLPSQLFCQLHNVILHADIETDEVFAQMTLQPVSAVNQDKDLFLSSPDNVSQNRQPNDFFCKTLTNSDTSTHGGFSVPRRAAEKVFPPLDFTKQPPSQELHAKDLHDQVWTFRHIYRGQPKRHLLTTGWSVFVSAKRLVAGDSVLFIRDEKGQLLLGIRRANRQQIVMPSSVLSTDSMHIGVLAAAAHASATSSRFLVFYNPRTSPSEFVVPLAKYNKAVYGAQISVGMRFRMVFEIEDSTLRRYMGTITGINDLDHVRWPSSPWRNLEVGWDESSSGERPRRVSAWEIEPVSSPFLCPPQFSSLMRPKRPWMPPGLLGDEVDLDGSMKRCLTWLRGETNSTGIRGAEELVGAAASPFQSLSADMWMRFQQRAENPSSTQLDFQNIMAGLQDFRATDPSKQLLQQALSRLPHQQQQSVPNQQQQSVPHQQQQNMSYQQQQNMPHQQQQSVPHQQQNVLHQQQQSVAHQQQNVLHQQQQSVPHQQQNVLHQQQQSVAHQQQNVLHQQQQSVAHQQQNVLHQQQQSVSHQQQSVPHQQQNVLHQQQQSVPHQQQNVLHQQQQSVPHQQQSVPHQQQNVLHQQQQSVPHQQQSVPHQQQQSVPHQQQIVPHQQQQSVPHQQQQSVPHQQQNVPHQQQQYVPHQHHNVPQKQQQFVAHQQHVPQQQQQSVSHQQQQSVPYQQQQNLPHQQQQFLLHQQQSMPHQQQHVLHQHQSTSNKQQQQSVQIPVASSSSQIPQLSSSTHPTTSSTFLEPADLQAFSSQNMFSRPNPGNVKLDETSPLHLSNIMRSAQNNLQPSFIASPSSSAATATSILPVPREPQQVMNSAWFSPPNDPTLADTPLLSNMQMPQSHASLAATSSSYLIPPELQDTPLVIPATSASLSTRSFSMGKDVHARANSGTMLPSSFPSPSGSFQSSSVSFSSPAASDISMNAGIMASGGLDDALLQRSCSWPLMPAPVRTYTKVQKFGSVGRSLDVSRFQNYEELRHELARMFNLEGQLEDPQRSSWQLVFVDNEGDVLLVGDDPWEEFVSCVRIIRILSPTEVIQMSQQGMELLNTIPMSCCTSEDGHAGGGVV